MRTGCFDRFTFTGFGEELLLLLNDSQLVSITEDETKIRSRDKASKREHSILKFQNFKMKRAHICAKCYKIEFKIYRGRSHRCGQASIYLK
jgi:hypothetical protein